MKTGIVILNYNDYESTKKMIDKIKNYKSLNHIVIVDNNSSDDSYEKLQKLKTDNIYVIKTDENKGYAYGNNYGIKYLTKNYKIDNIIISNPDIIVEEEVIKGLIKDLKENKDISIIAPLIKQNGEEANGWRIPTFKDELLSNINYVHRWARKKMFYPKTDEKLQKVEVVSGCFFMIRKSDFEQIGYFDEGTFLYYEENIISYKLKELNKNVYVDNELSVIHNESVSVDKNINSIRKYKILKTSQKYFQKKYVKANIFKIFILRMFYYISLFIAYIIYLISRIKKKI